MPRRDDPADPRLPTPRVSAKAVLAALNEVRRRGPWPLLQQLEREEPELAEQVLEGVSDAHRLLARVGVPPRLARRLQRRVQETVLVAVLPVRAAHAAAPPEPEAGPVGGSGRPA